MYVSRSDDVREIRVDVSRSVDGSRIRPTPEADDMICNSSGQHSQCSYYSNILTIWSSSILGPLLMGQWIFDIIWHFVHHTYFPSAGKKKHMRENTIIEPLHFLAHTSAILCLVLFVLCLYCANCGLWAQLLCGRQSRPFPGFLLIIPNSNFCISKSPFFSSSLRNKAIHYSVLKDKRQRLMHIRLRNSAFIFSIIHLISQNDQVGQSGQGGQSGQSG